MVPRRSAQHEGGLLRPWTSTRQGNQPFAHAMFYTYILRSVQDPGRHYTGFTPDPRARLAEHNHGKCSHSAKFAPWKLQCYFAFPTETLARNFERYLKSGSGRAFAKKHFEDNQPL
jgi:putative endonuclease